MASIRKRNTSWQAQVRKKGKPTITKSFSRKRDAEIWANTIESEIDRGLYIDRSVAEQTILNTVISRFSNEIIPALRGAKSEASRIQHLRKYLGQYSLVHLNSQVLAEYRDQRLKEVGPQSVKHELGLLNRILKHSHNEWGYILPNGIPTVSKPKLPAGRSRRPSKKELELLTLDKTIGVYVTIAVETGMRRGEVSNIRPEHILGEAHNLLLIPKTKTDTPRTIPLTEKALEALRRLLTNSAESGILKPDSLSQAFLRACKRHNITDLHFHDLRHEATSSFFERGLNIMEVSLITGHRSLSMLQRYTHLKPESLIDRLNA